MSKVFYKYRETIESVSLAHTGINGSRLHEMLKCLENLKHIRLDNTSFHDRTIFDLPTLESLSINNYYYMVISVLTKFKNNKSIEKLELEIDPPPSTPRNPIAFYNLYFSFPNLEHLILKCPYNVKMLIPTNLFIRLGKLELDWNHAEGDLLDHIRNQKKSLKDLVIHLDGNLRSNWTVEDKDFLERICCEMNLENFRCNNIEIIINSQKQSF